MDYSLDYKSPKIKWLLTFLAAILSLSCSESESESEAVFSHSVTHLVEKPDHYELFDIDSHSKSETVLYYVDDPPQIIDVLPRGDNSYFIFDNLTQSLYHWQHGDKTRLIAKSGNGPDDVDSGFRLETIDHKPYLMRRPGRSEIICDDANECVLHANEIFSKHSTYYERRESGEVFRSGYFVPGRGVAVRERYGEVEVVGAFFTHPDLTIAVDLNFSTIIPLPQKRGYLQKFTGQPFVVLLDYDNLEVLEVFEIEHFRKPVIRQVGRRGDRYYEMDFSSEVTMSAWYYTQPDESILLIYRHSRDVPMSSHPLDIAMEITYYDYYRFDPTTLTIEYAGSSENYIIPLRTGFMMIEDYMLHYYEPVELM